MSITTKKGDKGKTGLLDGRRVFKDDIRIDILGDLDELCSFLGSARSCLASGGEKEIILRLQKDLFILCSEIASGPLKANSLKKRISRNNITYLEYEARKIESLFPKKLHRFCLPGDSQSSCVLHIARAVARRCERKATTLARKKYISNAHILKYLNRLSDVLYLLALKTR